ncbi:MAG: MoaD family protein [Candidatus Nezhaarchaeota archaeon]|nr:MoaD family protein [Candidatus Nezhaarchaeota archaeon]
MATVEVKFFATVREAVGVSAASVTVKSEATIKDLLELLAQAYGDSFRRAVYDADGGSLKPSIIVLLNGHNIDFLGGLATRIKPGDTVAILPPAVGG